NQTLVDNGFLGSSPVQPSLAFSLKDLEIYRICRLRCPQFSIQQWVKVVCDIANINYRPTYRTQFSDAFDIYLELHRRLEKSLNETLGRDASNWRIKNCCPACLYKLSGEPTLSPSVIGAIDGNNSLKRFTKKTGAQDPLQFESDYFLPRTFVDEYAGEVKVSRQRRKGNNGVSDPTDGHHGIVVCTDCWKAANADKINPMLAMFDETGAFISVCRYGIIWSICDMIQSGELAKYPLATCAYLLEHLPDDTGIGYDIGCSFTSTVASSSLGPKAREKRQERKGSNSSFLRFTGMHTTAPVN
ncbi:hypothetical protein M422DRAFT_182296, partial [Sphaerobolus stellatus SS14]